MGADCANSHVNPVGECNMNKTLTPRLAKAKPCVPTTEKTVAALQVIYWTLESSLQGAPAKMAFSIRLEVLTVE